MPGGVAIILMIVLWLFVLAPLLLRGQKPIRKAGEAFDETRVVFEGDSGELPATRRRPRLSSSDVRVHHDDQDQDLEVVDSEEVVIEDSTPNSRIGRLFSQAFRRGETSENAEHTAELEPEYIDGDVVHELEPAADSQEDGPAEEEISQVGLEEDPEESTTYAYDDAYTGPADLLDPRAAVDNTEDPHSEELPEEHETTNDDLTAEELEFAQRRARRGGWDPEAAAQISASRYQRRQRTLIGLGVLLILGIVGGIVLGSWVWALPLVIGAIATAYLAALRNQVRAEEALRARRIRQLRRARLGVRNTADDDLPLPRQLRRPGAVVLEADDESPDFVQLDTVYAEDILGPEHEDSDSARPRFRVRDGLKAG
ncbi:hypothetical protein GP475_03905 [Corynebacterium poyangense]|uniref:Uncharacterized protein n=1 Tax=Corynebacterium poyangense TaxID=2684405 RepID=A0A7H0SMW0_9CORY|nr:gephyrin-like molybdotransferase receptor GlpR [Corynebacterium poyangense]MBZ8176283.1 hypothetical protein [Corynebacterium poyangense]QNQ89885.1 hypothetical protein GP475_03905 [Corynebacterium poyangense]